MSVDLQRWTMYRFHLSIPVEQLDALDALIETVSAPPTQCIIDEVGVAHVSWESRTHILNFEVPPRGRPVSWTITSLAENTITGG